MRSSNPYGDANLYYLNVHMEHISASETLGFNVSVICRNLKIEQTHARTHAHTQTQTHTHTHTGGGGQLVLAEGITREVGKWESKGGRHRGGGR